MNEEMMELLNAFGAMAELHKVAYDVNLKAGFTKAQALDLAKHQVSTQMMIAAHHKFLDEQTD